MSRHCQLRLKKQEAVTKSRLSDIWDSTEPANRAVAASLYCLGRKRQVRGPQGCTVSTAQRPRPWGRALSQRATSDLDLMEFAPQNCMGATSLLLISPFGVRMST